MEITSHCALSEYQRAILNEMGITSWQLAKTPSAQTNENKLTNHQLEAQSEVVSPTDALAKLKQLKTQTRKIQTTDSVLVTCSQDESEQQIFKDVIRACGFEARDIMHVSAEQISHYSDYPLSWNMDQKVGKKVSFEKNKLTTPALTDLSNPNTKRQLWMQIQSADLAIDS